MYDWHKKTGKAFLTSGIGYGKTELSAFDAAERDANIVAANAIKASSFIPPHWQIVDSKEQLASHTDNGVFLPMAYAFAASNTHNVAASLLVGINRNKSEASIIIEHGDVNFTKQRSLEKSMVCLEDIYRSRGWAFASVEQIAVEGAPRQNQYVCALVAAVLLVDHPGKT